MLTSKTQRNLFMDFPEQLVALRKQKGLSQNALDEAIGLHVNQVKRYEGGTSQPTLNVLRKLAQTLGVSADVLLFGSEERGPDEDLRIQFEAIKRLDDEEKGAIKVVLDSIILRHEAKRWTKAG